MFYIIAKFQENLSTQFLLKCKSGKNSIKTADFTIFSCVSSHISTLAHRNFTKLTQKLCLIIFYIIAKFQVNPSTQFLLKCKSGTKILTLFVSSDCSPIRTASKLGLSSMSSNSPDILLSRSLAHRNLTNFFQGFLTQKLCLIMLSTAVSQR